MHVFAGKIVVEKETMLQILTFCKAIGAEFILFQRKQRSEYSLESVHVFHRFSGHFRYISDSDV